MGCPTAGMIGLSSLKIKSLCKIKGLSVDYLVLLFIVFLLNSLLCFLGRLRGLEIKRSKVGTISVLCTL